MSDQLKRTPFYDLHVAAGAKMVPFAGFEMPVQYPDGITAEHNAVRKAVGLFDVTHMGEFEVFGKDALAFVSYVTSNDPAALAYGQVQYSCFMHESGGIVDDCLVYRLADRMMLVVNASNTAKDWAHVSRYASKFDVRLVNQSDEIALLALQGPKAQAVLQPLARDVDLERVQYYHCVTGKVAGVPCIISRTGYTGEDGFEIFCASGDAVRIWTALLTEGEKDGIRPVGLGARDTLRLEARLSLYGNDIDENRNPIEAGLGWTVKLDKPDFSGKAALQKIKSEGTPQKLVGFQMTGRGIGRHGYPLKNAAGAVVGVCTSGSPSPTLGINIGLGYLPSAMTALGTEFLVDCRGRDVAAKVVATPFYKRRPPS